MGDIKLFQVQSADVSELVSQTHNDEPTAALMACTCAELEKVPSKRRICRRKA